MQFYCIIFITALADIKKKKSNFTLLRCSLRYAWNCTFFFSDSFNNEKCYEKFWPVTLLQPVHYCHEVPPVLRSSHYSNAAGLQPRSMVLPVLVPARRFGSGFARFQHWGLSGLALLELHFNSLSCNCSSSKDLGATGFISTYLCILRITEP